MGKKIDLIGKIFGRLTVLNDSIKSDPKFLRCLCKCECGNYINVFSSSLRRGVTLSCGCLKRDRAIETHTTHGQSRVNNISSEYRSWSSMKSRCYNKNKDSFIDYGAKGVTVCDRWLNSFENFFADMGKKHSNKNSIDRFPNKEGNYEPGNCRWATAKEQAGNIKTNVWLEHNGIRMIKNDWARELSVDTNVIGYHLKIGKTFSETVDYLNNKYK